MNHEDKVLDKLGKIEISVAEIKQELKSMNGSVKRHEVMIENNRLKIESQGVTIAKLIGSGTLGGAIVGVITYLLQNGV